MPWGPRAAAALTVAAGLAVALSACTASPPPAPVVAPDAGTGTGAHAGQVSVYPQPGTRTASPRTQISIRGIAPSRIGTVQVDGSVSGAHTGTLRADSDGEGASLYLNTPLAAGETVTVHTHLPILGANAGSYRFTVSRPVAEHAGAGKEKNSDRGVQTFASAPQLRAPQLHVQAGTLSAAAGDIFLAPKDGPGQDGPMIVSPAGRLVWSDPLPRGQRAYDFREQTYQGQPVLTWWQGYNTKDGHGQGWGVIEDDTYHPVATVKAGNGYHADMHDFTITGRDTALVTAYQPVRWDTSSRGGSTHGLALDAIMQEIDIPTGNVLDEWHALDHVPLTDSFEKVKNAGTPFDYFHINSLDLAPDGDLLICSRTTHTVFDVDPATGDIRWRLGGKHSSFTGNGNDFSAQHDAKWLGPNRISLFDNAAGAGKPTASHSSGMIIDLDPAAHTATIEHSYSTPSVPRAVSQGNLQILPDGDAFVGWGSEPYVSEFTPDGKLTFQARLPGADQSYRAFRFPWAGHPLTSPSAVASLGPGGVTVKVSWNGATEVRSWRVLAGPSAGALAAVTTRPDTGFQTPIAVPGQPGYLQVQALGADGQLLGTSRALSVAG